MWTSVMCGCCVSCPVVCIRLASTIATPSSVPKNIVPLARHRPLLSLKTLPMIEAAGMMLRTSIVELLTTASPSSVPIHISLPLPAMMERILLLARPFCLVRDR